jgi:hypothetical protein
MKLSWTLAIVLAAAACSKGGVGPLEQIVTSTRLEVTDLTTGLTSRPALSVMLSTNDSSQADALLATALTDLRREARLVDSSGTSFELDASAQPVEVAFNGSQLEVLLTPRQALAEGWYSLQLASDGPSTRLRVGSEPLVVSAMQCPGKGALELFFSEPVQLEPSFSWSGVVTLRDEALQILNACTVLSATGAQRSLGLSCAALPAHVVLEVGHLLGSAGTLIGRYGGGAFSQLLKAEELETEEDCLVWKQP